MFLWGMEINWGRLEVGVFWEEWSDGGWEYCDLVGKIISD